MTERKPDEGYALNTAIAFLSVLLAILILSLAFRVIYPRIQSDRVEADPILISEVIQIEVLNGCGIPGLASRFTTTLRRFGFDVVETGNFDTFEMTESILISRNGNMENATRVARALGIPEDRILIEESPEFYLDATLVIGADYENLNID
ncbi:MAG: LytR C-terminal domain-containing protein [Balneolaceae bacterium]